MNQITVFQADEAGYFIGTTLADESPEEPGIYLIPRWAFEDAPKSPVPDGSRWRRSIDGLRWVLEKQSVSEPEETPPTEQSSPKSCTPAQGLVALFTLKRITEDNILEAIAQIPDPVQQYAAKIGYQRATSWERGSPTMQTMAQLLQLTEPDLDELFSYAASVKV